MPLVNDFYHDCRDEPLVPTLNGMGYMITLLDEVSEEFVRFAPQAPGPVADIGAAFGVAALAALERGAAVIANDIDPRHLDVISRKVPPSHRGRLTLLPGAFPDGVELPRASLGAVLLARVLHFLDGPQLERSAGRLYDSLAAGGKVFAVVDASVFLDEAPLRRRYEARRAAGDRWPGFFRDTTELLPRQISMMPRQVHYLDPDVLSRVFRAAGFEIEREEFFSRELPMRNARGKRRTSVGLIARKEDRTLPRTGQRLQATGSRL